MGYISTFTMPSSNFIEASSWALNGFDHKKDKDYILFEIDTEESVFTASAVSTSYFFKKAVSVDEFAYEESDENEAREKKETKVTFAADGRFLSKMIGILPKNSILSFVEKVDGDNISLVIKTAKQRLELPLLKGKRPPKSPKISKLGEVLSRDLIPALKVLPKISNNSGTSAVAAIAALDIAIHQDEDESKLTLMATDMYTLSEITIGIDDVTKDEKLLEQITASGKDTPRFLINAQDASIIAKETGNPDSVIDIGIDDNGKIAFSFENGRIACVARMETGDTGYARLKAAREESKVIVNTKEILDAIKQCNTMSWDSNEITLDIKKDYIAVTNKEKNTQNRVEYNEELHDENTIDEEVSVNFSFANISKGFVPIYTTNVEISWVSNKQFFRVSPVLDSGDIDNSIFTLVNPVILR